MLSNNMKQYKLSEIDTLQSFDCGDEDLNDFLLNDARFYDEQMLAHTYVFVEEDEVVAYYCLLNDKISQTDLDKSLWRKLRKNIPHEKHYDSYPAVKIGRLAITGKFAGRHLGTRIIDGIKLKLFENAEYSACRFLTVDAYRGALGFYEKNGFMPLLKEPDESQPTIPLYFDLKAVL